MSRRVLIAAVLALAACESSGTDMDGGIDLDRDGAREANADGGPQRGRPAVPDVGAAPSTLDAPADTPPSLPAVDAPGPDLPAEPGCATACTYPNASGVCQAGQCQLGACAPGWADCNTTPSDGCETSLSALDSCGKCGLSCAAPNATASCTAGSCSPLTCAAGHGDCNAWRPDGCETLLNTVDHCGSCARKCGEDAPVCVLAGGVPRCANPGASIDGQRLEFPCAEILPLARGCASRPPGMTTCPAGGHVATRTFTLGGAKGSVYEVMINFRGLLEGKTYMDGRELGDFFYAGGVPSVTTPNVVSLTISSPRQTYYLNHEAMVPVPPRILVLNHVKTLRIEGGATVTINVSDSDCAILRNCKEPNATTVCTPHIVPGVPPAPAGFNGQFLQLDVVGTKASAARPGEIAAD